MYGFLSSSMMPGAPHRCAVLFCGMTVARFIKHSSDHITPTCRTLLALTAHTRSVFHLAYSIVAVAPLPTLLLFRLRSEVRAG